MQSRRVTLTLPFGLALIGACGTSPDTRPATLEVVALSVLAPSCGQTQCHSASTQLEGFAFDTLDGARTSLRELVGVGGIDPYLLEVLRADGEERMPPDAPLADEDIALIETWINAGAPGL